MRALITGITGFTGSHLAEYLLEKGYEVYGLKRWRSPIDNIRHIPGKITLIDGDLLDEVAIKKVLNKSQPDKIFHLAAQSYVPASYDYPLETLRINTEGTVNLLESVRTLNLNPLIHICSTSEVYGLVPKEEQPITESTHLRPQNPYGLSKCGEDLAGLMYFKVYGLRTRISRAFSHEGPRRGAVFAVSSFAKQIAEIEEGIKTSVKVGNLDSVRTYLDVRDICEAYDLLLSDKCKDGEVYNIGGIETMRIGDMLNKLIAMSKKDIKVEVDPSLLRPADIIFQKPNFSKFQNATGWAPKIPFDKTLKDLLDYWRAEIKHSKSKK